ncbi:MAG TPA: ATP-binding protein [Myxococcales bacterium]|nr:ATP-binding protein [Myxococcales bacterium]
MSDPVEFLLETSRVLGESLDLSSTFAQVARLCVPAVADVAIFDLLEPGGSAKRVAVAAADAEADGVAQELLAWPPRDPDAHPMSEAVRSGRARVLRNVSDEVLRSVAQTPRHFELLKRLGFVSVLEAPLSARGSVLGVLSLARGRPDAYSDMDVRLAEALARRAAVAVENARLFTAEQAARLRAEEARARTLRLLSVTEGLEGALKAEEVAPVILQRGLVAAGAAGAAVLLVDDATRQLELLAWAGYDEDIMRGSHARFSLDTPVPVAHAANTGEVVMIGSRAEWEARFSVAPVAASRHGSWAAAPLSIGGRRIGVLGVSYEGERSFTAEDREFLVGLASQCAQALHRAQLFAAEHSARAAAEAAVKAREEFLSIASHELRTPLTPLTLQLGVLKRLSPAELVPRVETAQRQVDRLSRLVVNLLDVTRIGAGALRLEREEVELDPMVRSLPERFHEEARRQGCALSVEARPVRGNFDGLRIDQVLTNLLSNALKYGAGKPVNVRLWTEGDRVRIAVTDQGIGIAVGDQERIFERFERAVSSREFSGLGLGLYISRQIVEAHGGTISVASKPGQGSAFVVDLPMTPRAN